MVISKGSSIKYVRLERGKGGSTKSVLARIGGRGNFSCKFTYTIILFLQIRHKIEIKKISYSDSQKYPFPSPLYS